tara:strand:- start:19291 stop:20523 length:1233 start_codon:yes stop_codon:yes gene_type:complete
LKISYIAILYFALEILSRASIYFFSYILNLPILKIIPITPILILLIYPKINFKRALNSSLPFVLFTLIYQLFKIIIDGEVFFTIYNSILILTNFFSLTLIFEVVDRHYSDKWLKTIPNVSLLFLFIQVIGFLFTSPELKYQLFSTNVISWWNLVLFNKFLPGSNNKLNFIDYIKVALSLTFMYIVGSRACLLVAILILLSSFILRLLNFFSRSEIIYNFYYKKILDIKLRNLLIFLSLLIVPYYLSLTLASNYLLGDNNIAYKYIENVEECVWLDNSDIENEACELLQEEFMLARDPSFLIRSFSDMNNIKNFLNKPMNLIFPAVSKTNNEDEGVRNYFNRSHNMLISILNENGIFGLLILLNHLSKYDILLRNKNLRLNFISPYILLLGIFISNDIFPIYPLLLYSRKK